MRGLKLNKDVEEGAAVLSHPSRVRGLKQKGRALLGDDMGSHPSRVRGLKQATADVSDVFYSVAPFTGAWIETFVNLFFLGQQRVAPFTGAWIETNDWNFRRDRRSVAPFTGAWIETIGRMRLSRAGVSRTLHGCVD